MKIRTDEDIRAFQSALDCCRNTVWLVSPKGKQYNLKTARGQIEGISCLLNDRFEESQLFASSFEDEMVLFGFIENQLKCA